MLGEYFFTNMKISWEIGFAPDKQDLGAYHDKLMIIIELYGQGNKQ